MTIKTSKKKTYKVSWVDVPVQDEKRLHMQLVTDLPIADIARQFDGLEWLKRESEIQGDKTFEGFTKLISISKMPNGAVQLTLSKEG